MKNFWGILIIVLVVAVLGFKMFTYQVRQTESALVVRFGKPVRPTTEPGLYLRLPMPIERVYKFDSRRRIYEGSWRRPDGGRRTDHRPELSGLEGRGSAPVPYVRAGRDGCGGEAAGPLRNAQNSVIGRHYFNEFVNADPGQIRFEEIDRKSARNREIARSNYGIEVSARAERTVISEKGHQRRLRRMRATVRGQGRSHPAQATPMAERIHSDAKPSRRTAGVLRTHPGPGRCRGAGTRGGQLLDQLKGTGAWRCPAELEMLSEDAQGGHDYPGNGYRADETAQGAAGAEPQEIVRQAQTQAPFAAGRRRSQTASRSSIGEDRQDA